MGAFDEPGPKYTDGNKGGSSGSGASGPSEAQLIAAAMEQARASYREVLRRWGIPLSKNMLNLIEKAVAGIKTGIGAWNTTMFVDRLRHTPDYHDKFPGIRFNQGMTEATYNAQYKLYREQAKAIGEDFTRKNFSRALKHNVTPELYKARVTAIDALETWGPMMEGFKQALAANGYVDKAENITKKQLLDFAMGLGEKNWEALWQETVVGVNLERVAGVTIGKPPVGWGSSPGGGSPQSSVDHDWMHITRGDMLTIINQVEGMTPGFEVESITGQQWRDIGMRMRQFKGSTLAKYGITAKDLLEMELGGPRAAVIADKSEKLLAEQEAVFEQRATPMSAQNVGSQKADYNILPQQQ